MRRCDRGSRPVAHALVVHALVVHALVGLLATTATVGAQQIRLRDRSFDPLVSRPELAAATTCSWIVQFAGPSRAADRREVERAGARMLGYLPESAHVVRMPPEVARRVARLDRVRWVGVYAPEFKLEPSLRAALAGRAVAPGGFDLLLADKRIDGPPLEAAIADVGGRVVHGADGGVRLRAILDGAQLAVIAHRDEVLWIERAAARGVDESFPMDHARQQVGGVAIESLDPLLTGHGVIGHVYEGLEPTHPDFTTPPVAVCAAGVVDHGHAVAGIVFGNGTSSALARGLVPDARCLYTDQFSCAGPRSAVYDAARAAGAAFSISSWGSFPLTTSYTALSAALDDAVFAIDLPVAQSLGNQHTNQARAEAWAKNVISVGAVSHFGDADPANDSWAAGTASFGPAADGRIKPDLCAYGDAILCSDLSGAAGFAPGDFTTSFGGTSGANAIVGGALGLAIQLTASGEFGQALPVPGGSIVQNRPGAATAKAVLLHSAAQYPFDQAGTDNLREHQGWGMPDLARLYAARDATFLVDETEVLEAGASASYVLHVGSGADEFRATLVYTEPMANPAAAWTLVNDLDLVVTAPDGTTYRGNHGLRTGTDSQPWGGADDRDPVERVIVPNPAPGAWQVAVIATQINHDARPETIGVDDIDFALVVSPVVDPVADSVVASGLACADATGALARLATSGRWARGRAASLGVVAHAPGGSVLMAGTSSSALRDGTALPIALDAIGAPGCSLYQSAVVTISLPGGAPAAGHRIPIPNAPALVGLVLHWQGAFFDPAANALGLGTTELLTITIG